jgi:hypothetical protein
MNKILAVVICILICIVITISVPLLFFENYTGLLQVIHWIVCGFTGWYITPLYELLTKSK